MISTSTSHATFPFAGRVVASPLGALTLVADAHALRGLYFEAHRPSPRFVGARGAPSAVLDVAAPALDAYFDGDPSLLARVPLALEGTSLERAVWESLGTISLGATETYGAIASRIGHPTAARAVGGAVGRNPLSIFLPCHRVVGASGALTGYAGGVERKRWLLAHESRLA
jgi:methylated-DNA-[protein]-cysteine S-methyltransferase